MKISENRWIIMPLGLLAAIVCIVGSAAIVWANDHNTVARHSEEISDQTGRIRRLEESQQSLAVLQREVQLMREDVQFLRRRAENGRGGPTQ